jgi:hypothetical protein
MTAQVHVKKQSDADRLRRNLEEQGRAKPKKKSHVIVDDVLTAFTRECGTVEDWDGDPKAWRAALGAFTLGWNAHAKRRKVRTK